MHQLQDLTKQPSGLLNIMWCAPFITQPSAINASIFLNFLDEYPNIKLNCDCDSKQVDMIIKRLDIAFEINYQ